MNSASDTNSTKLGKPIAVRPWPWVVSLVCVLVALVFFGRNLDFSAYAHPDEPGKIAQIVEARHNFNHPLLMLNSVRFLTGALGKSQDFEFVKLTGRWSSVIFSSLAIGLLVLVAGRLHGRFVAAAAGAFLITNPMLFQLSRFFKEDPALLFGLSLTLVAMMVFSSSKSAPAAVFLGVASACAVSGKYAGALIIPFSLYIIFACSENRRRDLAAMLLACSVAFFLINLPAFVSPGAVYRSLDREVETLAGTQTHATQNMPRGVFVAVPHLIYLEVYWQVSTVILTALLAAYGYDLFKRGFQIHLVEKIIIFFPIASLLLLSVISRPIERYLLPASALLACLSAFGLGIFPRSRFSRMLAIICVLAAVIQQIPRIYRADMEFKQDTQKEVLKFIETQLPIGSVLMTDWRVFLPPLGSVERVRRNISPNDTVQTLRNLGVTHVAVTSRMYQTFFDEVPNHKKADSENFQKVRAAYKNLFENGILVKEWNGGEPYGLFRPLRIYSIENAKSSDCKPRDASGLGAVSSL